MASHGSAWPSLIISRRPFASARSTTRRPRSGQPPHELDRGREEPRMRRLADQRAFRQRLWKVVGWDEELRVAEVLDRADSDDHLLAGAFGALDLPIKVRWIEHIGRRLHPGPERREADHLEGMLEQRRQGRARVQSEALRLERAEADA